MGARKNLWQLGASLPQAGVFRIVLCAANWPVNLAADRYPSANKLVYMRARTKATPREDAQTGRNS